MLFNNLPNLGSKAMNPIIVRRDDYLRHALTFNDAERTQVARFAEWLPHEIIDGHVHCNTEEQVLDVPQKACCHMLSTFPYFSLEESYSVHGLLYPGKTVRCLRFPNAFRGIDQKRANAYLLDQSHPDDRVALFGLPEDVEYTRGMLSHERVSALKMYYSYVEPTAEVIYDCFPPRVLERAQQLDIPIVLHLPKVITRSQDDLAAMLKDFPSIRIVLAHLGLSKSVIPGLREAFLRFAEYPNVSMDTALNPSSEVVALAIETFGWRRIIFGSDEPLNLLRSRPYRHPVLGERLVTNYPYHWADPQEQREYAHLARNLVHAQWLSLSALFDAIENLPADERESAKTHIFSQNAKRVYGF
ncbi:MAG: amidohydrolase family protein [Candidatus Moranbacteria bacterium]|nr:amidohydrolase family protein [Candidatus Moranbacteria bacterium]